MFNTIQSEVDSIIFHFILRMSEQHFYLRTRLKVSKLETELQGTDLNIQTFNLKEKLELNIFLWSSFSGKKEFLVGG